MDRPLGSDGGKPGLPPLETIGPYRILNRLGGGGMGVIYRAIHVETGRQAAVKTVRFPHRANLSSMRVEIHALGRLKNPEYVCTMNQSIATPAGAASAAV